VSVRAGALLVGLGLALAGCAGDQTGSLPLDRKPVLLPRLAAERGPERDHAALVAAFGGEYDAPAAKALLEEIVARLVPHTEPPAEGYAVTLLDSAVANAFALPSGRLYLTRGLLVLANDTAEIAAVIAHEIAHVTRRHAVERGEFEARSLLVSQVEASVLGNPKAGTALRERSRATLAGFSRAQEIEADALGVATLAAAGYDPFGAARFLRTLERSAALLARSENGAAASPDMLSTHPATAERIALATRAAQRAGARGVAADEHARYLAAIDGMAFGDNPADGLVRGRRFLHPRLGVAFEAPPGFTLENTPRAVLGATADGRERLLFDAVEVTPGQSLADVTTATWAEAIEPGSLESRDIGGMEAATAYSQGKDWTFRLAAIRVGGGTYRLILAAQKDDAPLLRDFEAALSSIHAAADGDREVLRPLRIAVVTAGAEDSLATMTARMATDRPEALFALINNLDPSGSIRPGGRYKLVVD
jgi:predicted Zn-dependent protease